MNQSNFNPTIQYSPELTIIHANQEALQLSGFHLENAVGLSIHQFWNAIIDTKNHSDFLLMGLKNNGFPNNFGSVDCKPVLLYDPSGKINGILVEYFSLTSQQEQSSMSIFEEIYHQSPYSISINKFPLIEYLDANHVHEQFYGYSKAEIIGKLPGELNIWADDDLQNMFDLFNSNKGLIDYPIKMRKKDGTIIPVLLTNKLIHVNNSDFIVTFSRDYSQEFLLQQELKRSESFLRTALETSSDGFFDWHIDGSGSAYANLKLHEMLGYLPGEIQLSFDTWVNHIYREDLVATLERTQRIVEGQYNEGYDRYRMVRKGNDSPFWVLHHHKVAETDSKGKPTRLIGTITDLTEQMKIEEELRDQKELLESVFSSIEEGIWDFHVKKKTLRINPQCAALLQINESQVSFHTFKKLCTKNIHPDDLKQIEPKFMALLSGKESTFHIFCRMIGSTQSWRWVEVLGKNAESTKNGIPLRIVGTVKDVTRDKELENHLLKTQYGVDNAVVMIFLIGPDEKFQYANKLAVKKIGYTEQELLTKTIFDLEPKYSDQTQGHFFYGIDYLTVIKNETYFSMESEIMTKTGSRIPVIISASYLEIDKEAYVWAFVKDIQALKSVEKQLLVEQGLLEQHVEEQTRELAASRDFLEFILNILPFPFYFKDQHLQYIDCNQMFADFFGFSRTDLVGKTCHDVTRKEFADNAYQGDLSILEKHSSIVEQSQLSNRYGEIRDVLLIKKAFTNNLTGETGIVGTFIDITDQIRLQAKLAQTNTELESALQIKDEFMANISHELKTPLTAIIGASEIILSGVSGELGPHQEKYARQILNSGEHLLNLINDILEYSKMSAEASNITKQIVRIRPICIAAVAMLESKAFKKNIQIQFSFDDRLTTANIDPQRIRQVLINLLQNAIKFTPTGGEVGLEVKPVCKDEINMVEFIVWDSGIGISIEEQEHIFDLFYQAQSHLSRSYEGSGIGLALVKKFVEEHQGTILVDSVPNQGSKFRVYLPLD